MQKVGSCLVPAVFKQSFVMYYELENAVFGPKAYVTVTELLEIDRSATQSL